MNISSNKTQKFYFQVTDKVGITSTSCIEFSKDKVSVFAVVQYPKNIEDSIYTYSVDMCRTCSEEVEADEVQEVAEEIFKGISEETRIPVNVEQVQKVKKTVFLEACNSLARKYCNILDLNHRKVR